MPLQPFKGILFDFDGTLADTMESHFLAWKATLAEYGISVEENDYFPLEGLGLREVAEIFAQNSLSDAEIGEVVKKKKGYYIRNHRTRFYPGIEDLIRRLSDNNVPMAIVTAGHGDQLRESVPSSFLGHFDVIVTGEQFTQGKPHPEPYLRGARDLGLEPGECIAVENAPIGVESAKRAGIYCIAVCTTVGPSHLSRADEILEDIDHLLHSKVIQNFLKC